MSITSEVRQDVPGGVSPGRERGRGAGRLVAWLRSRQVGALSSRNLDRWPAAPWRKEKRTLNARLPRLAALAIAASACFIPHLAGAIPVYSRKYSTSCLTCHTVYPKLTPFGEAFRRNGNRFPGAFDSDYVKQEVVELGQEANKKDFPNAPWPSWMTMAPGLGFSANGRIVVHPTTGSAAAAADGKTLVSIDQLSSGGNLFAAASVDDAITAYAVVGVSETAATLNTAYVTWNDVIGPRHLVNLLVGSTFPTLTPFALSSTYAGGRQIFTVSMTTLYKGTGAPFRAISRYPTLELRGVAAGRIGYSVGVNGGAHVGGTRSAENFYGHLAFKVGGMRLDGERDGKNPVAPGVGSDTALTLWGFGYRSNTKFDAPAVKSVVDVATTLGGGLRGQVGVLELNVGGLWERHGRVTGLLGPDGQPGAATQQAYSAELSWLAYPWLAPAVRVEHVIVIPSGGARASDSRLLAAIGVLLRPNVKVSVSGVAEQASRQVDAGGAWRNLSGSGLWVTPSSPTSAASAQLSFVNVDLSVVF